VHVSRAVSYFELPEYAGIITFIEAIFAELNMGLFIYHVEDPQDRGKLKLIYANKQASAFTGTDLSRVVGMRILEAFPALDGTDIPEFFLDVFTSGRSRRYPEALDYGDANVKRGKYSVRCFPMPHDCVGVLFEREGAD
jgi:hypothetical protein